MHTYFVHVNIVKVDLIDCFGGLLKGRADDTARTAPCCPEIDDDGLLGGLLGREDALELFEAGDGCDRHVGRREVGGVEWLTWGGAIDRSSFIGVVGGGAS